MRSSTHQKGKVGELAVKKYLTENGFIVSEPITDARYDLVVEISGGLKKVQVKAGYHPRGREDKIEVDLQSNSWNMSEGLRKTRYTKDEVDSYAVYNPTDDEIYWYDFDEVGSTGICRLIETHRENLINRKI